VKGCLSEKGVYAALGCASVGVVERGWFGVGPIPAPALGVSGSKGAEGGDGKEMEKGKGKSTDEPPEEVALARKLWARGPIQLENPNEITLHTGVSSTQGAPVPKIGVGFVHLVKVT